MSQQHRLEVIDREGWHQFYPLEKSLVRIGRAPTNEIVLEEEHGQGVSDLHAQLIASTDGEITYQLVNLTSEDIWLDETGDKLLPPGSAISVADHTMFVVGEFKLVFHTATGAVISSAESPNQNIGLSLEMPQTTLAPGSWLDAVVLVTNQGEQSGVQFELDLDGLEPDCYDLAPGPLLSSGGEGRVSLRLYHRNARPLSGEYRITVRAAAPWAYGGEYATVSQIIRVFPYYEHVARLLDPDETDTPPSLELASIDDAVQGTARALSGQPAGEEAGVWSAEGSPSRRERDSLTVKARPPRTIAVTETTEEDAADWWDAPPVTPAAPPPAIPAGGKSLAGGALVAGAAVGAGEADWWAEPEAESMVQEPLPAAAPTTDKSGDRVDSPEVLAEPEREIPAGTDTDEPAAAGVEAGLQEPPPPATAKMGEVGDWWEGPAAPAEPAPEPESPSVAAAVTQASAPKVDQPEPEAPDTIKSDETDAGPVLSPPPVKPRIFKPETGPEPELTLPPTAQISVRQTPAGKPQISGDSEVEGTPDNEFSEPTFDTTTQSYLDKADAESNRARQLASEVESAVESQTAKSATVSSGSSETAPPLSSLSTDQRPQQKPVPVVPAPSAEPPEWAHEVWGGDVEDDTASSEKSESSEPEHDQQLTTEQTSPAVTPAKASDRSPDSDPADWWDDDLIDSQSRRGRT